MLTAVCPSAAAGAFILLRFSSSAALSPRNSVVGARPCLFRYGIASRSGRFGGWAVPTGDDAASTMFGTSSRARRSRRGPAKPQSRRRTALHPGRGGEKQKRGKGSGGERPLTSAACLSSLTRLSQSMPNQTKKESLRAELLVGAGGHVERKKEEPGRG